MYPVFLIYLKFLFKEKLIMQIVFYFSSLSYLYEKKTKLNLSYENFELNFD